MVFISCENFIFYEYKNDFTTRSNRAIQEWEKRPNEIEYNQLEGFVRQIIGWREYMRGIYWLKMPDYASMNFSIIKKSYQNGFGKTKMHWDTINQSLNYGYAHHIQLNDNRNFALLAGINPDELDAWYLGIYIDAIEWVEITNTRG
jgi:deoxyribodipyrimidine photolyase-related protein